MDSISAVKVQFKYSCKYNCRIAVTMVRDSSVCAVVRTFIRTV